MADQNSPRNCQSCERTDSAECEMVQCDFCKLWEHFGCAGVDEQIRQPSARYACKQCSKPGQSSKDHLQIPGIGTRSTKGSKAGSKVGSKKGKKNPGPPDSVTSSVRAVLLSEQLKLIEEEKTMKEQALLEEEGIRKRLLEEEERQLEEKNRLRGRKLQEELEMKRKQQQIKKRMAEASSRSGSVVNSDQKVKDWLDGQNPGRSDGNVQGNSNIPLTNPNPEDPEHPLTVVPQNPIQPTLPDMSLPQVPPPSPPVVGPLQSLLASLPNPSVPIGVPSTAPVQLSNPVPIPQPASTVPVTSIRTLSQTQIAARQVLGKDLPVFCGNPEDWPIFISNFEQSTTTCGYSDAENLVRLQRCLKGNAFESVKSRLLLPASVPHVIQTLRTLFGRPDLLIRSMMNKIQQVPAPRHDRLETVMHFGIAVQNLVDHLKAAQQFNHLTNPVLLQELVEKLPGSLRLDWAVYKTHRQPVTLDTFGKFMSGLVTAASEVSYTVPGFSVQKHTTNYESRTIKPKGGNTGIIQAHLAEKTPASTSSSTPASTKPGKVCLSCGRAGHRVSECHQFNGASVDERWKLVKQKALCRTCLNNHGKWPCRSWKGCEVDGCRQKHHTLLHSSSSFEQINVSSSHVTSGESQWPLFRILPVILYGNNSSQIIFAFIDEGSSYTLLDETVAKELCVNGKTEALTLKWTGNVTRVEPKSQCVQLDISGKNISSRYTLSNVRKVSRLVLPTQSIKYQDLANRFPHLRGLPLSDYELVEPKLLIGLDNLRLCVPLKLREGGPSHPIGAKCRLGWSIYGYVPNQATNSMIIGFHVGTVSDRDRELNQQLRDYFTLEDAGVAEAHQVHESKDEQRAIQLLRETTRRTADGSKFETGLLWSTDEPNFPDSYPMAVRRLESLERRLQRDPELKERVHEQILDYESKGYAHRASLAELTSVEANRVWYLPLGVVTNPRKPGKVRLIWDAAAKVGGVSFNSRLLKGPDLLAPLAMVLCQFRQYPVAVSGDVMEMFHQIKIRSPDCQSQRFIFRNRPVDQPQVYVMDVATFGSSCSPASAQYVKNFNADEFASEYPRAAVGIKNKHYVDDYLDSFETTDEAIAVANEVKLVHSRGGFTLRSFLSNEPEVLQGIGETITEKEPKNLHLERDGKCESVLGMKWIPHDDVFIYAFGTREDLRHILENGHIPTKREVAKVVMSLFDPLGLIAFLLIHGKIFIQELWAAGIEWDQEFPHDLNERWRQWVALLQQLDSLRIPRCYFRSTKDYSHLQIHLFVDASESAYSCVVYFRLENEDTTQVKLVGAKTKVAPLKTLSIPRLELKAAVLGARFMETVQKQHTYTVSRRFCWSDASTVLAWVRSTDHRRYHKFVAVRIGEILSSTQQSEWRWVPSKQNIADFATKWRNGMPVTIDNPWFQGPAFLYEPEERWPKQRTIVPTEEELRPTRFHATHFAPNMVFERFNRWTKMHRVAAYVFRGIENFRRCRSKDKLELGNLTSEELRRAEEELLKTAQTVYYTDEINNLVKTQGSPENHHVTVDKSSPIYTKCPFLDENGVLRSRGRIGAAPYAPTEAKFPIILPNQHLITFLIVDWYHRRFRHANRETIFNEIRQRFEIPALRRLLDKVERSCTFCRVTKAMPRSPAMAPLPEMRLTAFTQPFTFTGLDYFGPMIVKVGRSNVKRWVALFTCLTIRAIHMEIVHSLSTESCIMAVQRFVARRGLPREFWTDNATCFQAPPGSSSPQLLHTWVERGRDSFDR
ncbi:uncharacterized protein LOC129766396 [Toxorhynchites rutilus septentrionalis]|uniref:uncharacterized protein LOC129766396 n=1 Tax=Toxorhynchites rutilus septentrionalis TaxID=329112 RepID=UPI00247A5E2B|nr:uncharacterized protein LOC129766396 [Toxorhynchites rutilus septentrionalis]